MAAFTVKVKWNKQVFEDVKVDTNDSAEVFKAQISTLTNVPVDRQKLMCKAWKGVLKDDMDMSSCKFKDGMQIMLMGSADVVEKPQQEVVFMEDLKDEDLAKAAPIPAGLNNLGNTCYMNSTLQCLRHVPELREGLKALPRGGAGDSAGQLSSALRDTYETLDRSPDSIPPVMFLSTLHQHFPQFAQRSHGAHQHLMQQDAEELYSTLMVSLTGALKDPLSASIKEGEEVFYTGFPPPPPAGSLAAVEAAAKTATEGEEKASKAVKVQQKATVVRIHYDDAKPYYTVRLMGGQERQTDADHIAKANGLPSLGQANNLVDALFGLQMEEELTCDECAEEPKKVTSEVSRKLVCNIEGGAGKEVQINHLSEGVLHGMNGKVEKHSEILGRDGVWTKKQRIKRLPRYICVQYMRFFWKASEGVKCKIRKPVSVPKTLDVFDFCSEDLQKVLKRPRDKAALAITAKLNADMAAKASASGDKDGEKADGAEESKKEEPEAGAAAMEVEDEDAEALAQAIAMSNGEEVNQDGAAGVGLPADFKGNYELFAVVTHKGRDADSGHYMGWVRDEGDKWLVFNDDEVSETTTEAIMELKGGGDWHMAYLTFYRYKD